MIRVEFDDDDDDKAVFQFTKRGVLKIKGSAALRLRVTCTDSSDNVGRASAEVLPRHNDDDDDSDDDRKKRKNGKKKRGHDDDDD